MPPAPGLEPLVESDEEDYDKLVGISAEESSKTKVDNGKIGLFKQLLNDFVKIHSHWKDNPLRSY